MGLNNSNQENTYDYLVWFETDFFDVLTEENANKSTKIYVFTKA
jgi:hypothetical protein